MVGTALEDRDAALASLDALLLLGLPVALLLAGAAGYVVAGAALRPIERLRARAEVLGARDLAQSASRPEARRRGAAARRDAQRDARPGTR